MANWPPEVAWHERDVVVPLFQLWLEAHGWETETETAFVDLVARRGNETIYAEAKGRTKSRPGAGLDTLYGQLLRRMPAEEVDDPNTRFAVVIPSGLEAAALRVPRRIRERLRIDIYAVSDDGQVRSCLTDLLRLSARLDRSASARRHERCGLPAMTRATTPLPCNAMWSRCR
jgi:hypothetical protein